RGACRVVAGPGGSLPDGGTADRTMEEGRRTYPRPPPGGNRAVLRGDAGTGHVAARRAVRAALRSGRFQARPHRAERYGRNGARPGGAGSAGNLCRRYDRRRRGRGRGCGPCHRSLSAQAGGGLSGPCRGRWRGGRASPVSFCDPQGLEKGRLGWKSRRLGCKDGQKHYFGLDFACAANIRNQGRVIRISLDVMGGDFGPEVVIPAAAKALERHPDITFILFGLQAECEPYLQKYQKLRERSVFHDCELAVGMDEKPSAALRRGRYVSTMWRSIEAVKSGEADVAVSAGNTGALMAMAKFCLRTMANIERPAIAGIWPTLKGESIVLDIGATIGADAQQLLDFALMGGAMARALF